MPRKPQNYKPRALPRLERPRKKTAARGYDGRWQKARKAFLYDNPWCAECAKEGLEVPATAVDHVIPHKGDPQKFWDMDNWSPICSSCHGRKTALLDGGLGRPVVPAHLRAQGRNKPQTTGDADAADLA